MDFREPNKEMQGVILTFQSMCEEGSDICDLNNWKVLPCCEGAGGQQAAPVRHCVRLINALLGALSKCSCSLGVISHAHGTRGCTICSPWKCHLEPVPSAQAWPVTCPSLERTPVFEEMLRSDLVCTSLRPPGDGENCLSLRGPGF